MRKRTAADVFVECLEAEGVRHVFGIPGEETLDFNESLDRSSIRFVPVRHEQGGAYIADVYGRLTGRAGVCLGTLGPGATNLVTGIADAFLDRAPMVALTGQASLVRMHKESHQYLDVVNLMRPITKWNARVGEPAVIPEVVRKAFKLAEGEKPGATHIELPEDVMGEQSEERPLPRRDPVLSEPSDKDVSRAAELISAARAPVALAGNGVVRNRAVAALRSFVDTVGLRTAVTFMGKGLLDPSTPQWLGAVGLQAGDYEMAGFGGADLVVAIGFDLVEHSPRLWNPRRDKTIVCLDTLPAEIDAYYLPEVEVVGDLNAVLDQLRRECRPIAQPGGSTRLRDVVLRRFEEAKDDASYPMQPPRVLFEIRKALGPSDILVSDVGLHKLWIGRMFPAYEPNTVLIANGLAGMGFAVPAAIAAKLVHPDRKVVAVSGDGGFLMNSQELETAVRLGTPFVNVIWEDRQFGSIAWKQRKRFGRDFGTDFSNPDFVRLAESFGLPAWRVTSADDFAVRLRQALELSVPTLIVLEIDYSVDVAIADELGEETGPHLRPPGAAAHDAADTADRFSDTAADQARWEDEGGAVLPISHREEFANSFATRGSGVQTR
ncbi:MAG: acetolactate synthase large subunit [Acidobacteria bacterium]|nr:acetolactate synthase large subunit [Acidobacteriota bacterium]